MFLEDNTFLFQKDKNPLMIVIILETERTVYSLDLFMTYAKSV